MGTVWFSLNAVQFKHQMEASHHQSDLQVNTTVTGTIDATAPAFYIIVK